MESALGANTLSDKEDSLGRSERDGEERSRLGLGCADSLGCGASLALSGSSLARQAVFEDAVAAGDHVFSY